MKHAVKVSVMMFAMIWSMSSLAAALEVVAEARIESVNGEPVQEQISFWSHGYEGFVLKVQNGADDGANRVSSAMISLNEVKVLGPADFSQKVPGLQRAIAPHDVENQLSVSLRSNPGGYLLVQVLGEPTLNLPPDPGPAGDATIEGVDVNDNGVRDDIERWIALTYRDSEKTRMALTQAYYPIQNMMIHARDGDRDGVYNDMDAFHRASECLYYINSNKADSLITEIESNTVNTSKRVYSYFEANNLLAGGTFMSKPYSEWSLSCTFDPNVLDN